MGTIHVILILVVTCDYNDILYSVHVQHYLFVFLLAVKESESDKQSEPDTDCAEQDVGCWSLKWSARYTNLHLFLADFHTCNKYYKSF